MTDAERLTKILQAHTLQDLESAMDGYQHQVITIYPRLADNRPFNFAMERKQYFHALCDIKRASRGIHGGDYADVIGILEHAAEKRRRLSGP